MANLRTLFLSIFLLLAFSTFSQDLIINYTEPSDLIVCDSNDFSFTLTNASPDTLFNVAVTVNTPTGLDYVPSSISLGIELDISIPNAPVFSYPFIPPLSTIEFSIGSQLKCPLVNSINSGALFTNTISANWTGGNNSVTTTPYLIETPLLVITNVTNTVTSGTQGDVIIRTITIQNTRLGALSSFTFSDNHGGGIAITSPLGTLIDSTDTSFAIELTGNDFMTVGDGDELFEKDEVIVITEFVEILDCGFDVQSTNSQYSISWGCFSESCQTTTNSALIDIIPSTENPSLVFFAFSNLPTDYCAGTPAQQGITITNEGVYEAVDVFLDIDLGIAGNLTFERAGFDPATFVQDSSGIVTAIDPGNVSIPAVPVDCPFPSGIFKKADFYWPTIPAGEAITLTWDYYYCDNPDECGTGLPPLNYEYSYMNHCPEDTLTGSGSTSLQNVFDLLDETLWDSVFYYFGEPLVANGSYDINYVLRSEKLLEPGILNIEFELPCGFSWGATNNLVMGGQVPFDVQVNNTGLTTKVTAQYNLPMNSDDVMTTFQVNFQCDPSCGGLLGACLEPYITSTGEIGCGSSEEIQIVVTLQEDPSVALDCSMHLCRNIELMVECIPDDFPIPGQGDFAFLLFENDFERCNFDLPDNNDDRLADPSGDLNFNLVRKDRTIPGDTVTNEFRGMITFPTGEFPVDIDLMTVQFEAHTIDFGLDGGVSLDFGLNGDLLDEGGIEHLSATLRIIDQSTGAVYDCNIGPNNNVVDSIYTRFEVVNTSPPQLIDEILYNQFKYNTSLSNLSDCLPNGFAYENGDSIIFITKHRMVYNPLPQATDLPPVVNMRSAVVPIFCNFFNPYISAHPLIHTKFQYSGYKYEILPGEYHALPCDKYSAPGGVGVRFVLGMDNFFPFEYRPLSALQNWRIKYPTGVNVLEAKLIHLRYQQGNNIIFNEDLNFTINNGFHEFDVSQWHVPTLDEGWEMELFHEFDSDCTVIDFEAMELEAFMIVNPGLPEPSPNVLIYEEEFVFISSAPNVNLGVTQANFTSFDNMASWDLVAINATTNISTPAENAWIWPESPTGLMTDFQLINTTTGQVVPQSNGIFQVGTILNNQVLNFELSAINNSCETEIIRLHFGWNCDPYTNLGQTPCVDNVIIITSNSPVGELEMEVVSPNGPFDLCEVIDYHTVEIFNAQLGNVYDVLLEATLPLGLELLPNSSQLAYPTGNTFIDIPDPTNIAGNVFQWDISSLNSIIQANGLAGVSQDPDHSVSLRFQTTTDCGFIAGSQIVFNVKGQQNCDDPTNTLSKTGDPINITGVNPSYSSDVNIAITSATSISCGVGVPLNISILPDGPTSNADSILITLPPGVSYVSGSYLPLLNAPTNPPIVIDLGGQEILKLKLEAGIAANNLISFEVETTGYGLLGCGSQNVQVLAVQQQDATCTTTGELCYVLAETGSATITISSDHPALSLQNLDISAYGDSINYEVTIANAGIPNSSPIQVDFYIDNDSDGTLSNGDVLVGSGNYGGTLVTNQTVIFNGNFNLTSDQLCNLIAVIDEGNNCVCGTEVIPVNAPINAVLPDEVICSGAETELGIPPANGHTYLWDPAGNISSTNSSTTIFQYSNITSDTSFFNYTIIDESPQCEINHSLEVAVLPVPGINQQDLEICAGETVTLAATAGGSYVWEGPNINNPNQQIQTVTLFENTTYTVTVTLPVGCEGMDEINIDVLPYQENFSSLEKCPNETVSLFGQPITAAGTYCDTVANAVGCDSLICVEVSNFLTFTEERIDLCQGDSVTIDGIVYNGSDMVCNTMLSAQGCDSTHCITIEMLEEPFAEFIDGIEISIAEGEETQLQVTEGFADYEWSPATGLSCSDCHDPTTTLTESTDYSVTVTDESGCTTEIALLVTVLPPCNAGRLQIPNVFSPDNDGVNDAFGVVPYEGFEMVSSIKIFNRWGEKVYQNTGQAYWDGTQGGEPAPSDVYVYIIRIVCDEGATTLHGDITLIR